MILKSIKNIIRKTFLMPVIRYFRQRKVLRNWMKNFRPIPPPHIVKEEIIKNYALQFGVKIFIETGTFKGDMIEAVKNSFDKIVSIELDADLYKKAKERFSKHDHIFILHGNSAHVMPDVLQNITNPCLFWLDGHYSGSVTAKGEKETPILGELEHILAHCVKNYVILIDDARLFNGKNDYPTIDELRNLFLNTGLDLVFDVEDDIIRIYPKQ